MFCCLVAIKLWPTIAMFGRRQSEHWDLVLSAKSVIDLMFNPFQQNWLAFGGYPYRLHEFGCYVGLVSFGIFVSSFFSAPFRQSNARLIGVCLLWFWTASGWGTPINPWRVFQQIPLVNQAHLQSRVFILFFLFLIVLLARRLDGWWKNRNSYSKRTKYTIAATLVFSR